MAVVVRVPAPGKAAVPRRARRSPAITRAAAFVPYTPVQKQDGYELKLIGPHRVARVAYERRDAGFLALGEYLSGGNAGGRRFQETQPIVMSYPPGGAKTMQVYLLPREGEGDEGQPPPQPSDAGVELDGAGGELVAAARFEGNATKEACERARTQLKFALQRGESSCAAQRLAGGTCEQPAAPRRPALCAHARAPMRYLPADGLQLAEDEVGGLFRLAQYGPLHSLSTRVNEVWLTVQL